MSYFSSVNGSGSVAPTAPPTGNVSTASRPAAVSVLGLERRGDSVSLSPQALAASDAAGDEPIRPVRQKLIARIRAEIQAGTYDTPGKYQAAFEAMVEGLKG